MPLILHCSRLTSLSHTAINRIHGSRGKQGDWSRVAYQFDTSKIRMTTLVVPFPTFLRSWNWTGNYTSSSIADTKPTVKTLINAPFLTINIQNNGNHPSLLLWLDEWMAQVLPSTTKGTSEMSTSNPAKLHSKPVGILPPAPTFADNTSSLKSSLSTYNAHQVGFRHILLKSSVVSPHLLKLSQLFCLGQVKPLRTEQWHWIRS